MEKILENQPYFPITQMFIFYFKMFEIVGVYCRHLRSVPLTFLIPVFSTTREWNIVDSMALVHVTALIVVRSNRILFAD